MTPCSTTTLVSPPCRFTASRRRAWASSFLLAKISLPIIIINGGGGGGGGSTKRVKKKRANFQQQLQLQVSAADFSNYGDFVDLGIDEASRHTHLVPSPLQEKLNSMKALDGKSKLAMVSYKAAPKIRLLRSLSIQGADDGMQILDFAVFPEPEYDLPIFCANFFSASKTNIIVLDLNPLYDVSIDRDYKEKYYDSLLPLGHKYAELLPWGGKLTSESLRFFSPIVIWTRFTSSKDMYQVLYSAFMDYLKAWFKLMEVGQKEMDPFRIAQNSEAQHRYLTWRTEKDPGHRVLKRLIGEAHAKNLVKDFLFEGRDTLGGSHCKTFLDYFPEYQCEDGTVNAQRSMMGKSFQSRPWNSNGEFQC